MAKKTINQERSAVITAACEDIANAIFDTVKKHQLTSKEIMLTCSMAVLHVYNATEKDNQATTLKLLINTPEGIYKTTTFANNDKPENDQAL